MTEKSKRIAARFHVLLPYAVPLSLIALWQILAVTGILQTRILPSPGAVFHAAATLIQSGDLWKHLCLSTGRALAGLLIGGSIGFLLGLLTGISRIADTLLDSTVQMFRTIPNLAMIPLVILWFGIGEETKIFLIALGVFFPLYLNTYHGIRSIDPGLREMAQVYGVRGASVSYGYLSRCASLDTGGIAVLSGIHVDNPYCRRGTGGGGGYRLSDDHGPRVHADRYCGRRHTDLRSAWQIGRCDCAASGT